MFRISPECAVRPVRLVRFFHHARLSRGAAWAVLCSAFVGLGSHAQQALSLDQALRLAQDRSLQLVAQDAAASASRDMAVAASKLPDPVFKTGLNSLPVSGPDRLSLTRDAFTMLTLGVMQEFTHQDKLRARTARFDREAEAAEAARAVALATLRRDTAMAWLDRHYQERMLDLLRTQRSEAGLQIEAADAAYRGGRGAQADVFAARSAVALIDDRIRQTERQAATAKTRLARWVGAAANQALGTPPSLASVHLDEATLASRLTHHPQIALMLKQEEMARADADIAQSNQRTDWSVELAYSQRGPAYSNMVSVNVSIPLQWDQKNRQGRDLGAKLATVAQLRAQREEVSRDHLVEVQSWLEEWHSHRERLANHDATLIPLAAQRTRAALAAYSGGGATLAAVLEARRLEIDTRMDRLRLEMEAAVRWAQLEYLMPPAPAARSQALATDPKEP
jgi:outer membrane protein TolC